MTAYHDAAWGMPLHGDRGLFEFLSRRRAGGPTILDGGGDFQAIAGATPNRNAPR